MNTTIKFYLSALFIALVAFGGTSIIMRIEQATAPAAPAKLTITQQAAADKAEAVRSCGAGYICPPFVWPLPWPPWGRSGAV